ncbi:hypothetical protein CVT24_004561 [Panaeolus cyanescens]|uniref:DUF6535 domain-containing protein n=1 Tax=Panaeolus cyanescens TaxID=181874 RepID=A0A409VA37_9AGAR|nr:hypothetical protein CVT24_004561 [Panaeolus cyanescens]
MPSSQSSVWPPKPWTSATPLKNPLPESGDSLKKCVDLAMEYDEHLFRTWNEEIQNLLIFAGLFSGIVTAFALEAGKDLKEEPAEATTFILAQLALHLMKNSSQPPLNLPQGALVSFSVSPQNLRYNLFIFISLILGLSTALIGILCLQWLREFQQREHLSDRDSLELRHIRFEGLQKWHVPQIMAALPLMLQVALLCFFAGLIDWLSARDSRMAIGVGVVIAVAVGFLVWTTVMPTIYIFYRSCRKISADASECPYKSPQSLIVFKLFTLPFKMSNKWNDATNSNSQSGYVFLCNLSSVPNWSRFDKMWQERQIRSLAAPLVWLAKTFSDSIDSINAILTSARNDGPDTAWKFNLRLAGKSSNLPLSHNVNAQDLGCDIACYQALKVYIQKNEAFKKDINVLKYECELYVRILNTMDTIEYITNEYNMDISPPEAHWPYGAVPQVPQELVLQLLATLSKTLISSSALGKKGRESQAFWETLTHFVHDFNPSGRALATLVPLLDQIFEPLVRWVTPPLNQPPTPPPTSTSDNRYLFAHGLVFVIGGVFHRGVRRANVLKIFESSQFKMCMNEVTQDDRMQSLYHPFQDPMWTKFVTNNGLDSRYISSPTGT